MSRNTAAYRAVAPQGLVGFKAEETVGTVGVVGMVSMAISLPETCLMDRDLRLSFQMEAGETLITEATTSLDMDPISMEMAALGRTTLPSWLGRGHHTPLARFQIETMLPLTLHCFHVL